MEKVFRLLSVIAFSACLAGCQPSPSGGVTPNTAPPQPGNDARAPEAASSFELRDFRVEQKNSDRSGSSYEGRGTLIAKHPSHQKGVLLVLLRAKVSGKLTRDNELIVFVKDGVGTIETSNYASGGSGSTPEYSDWEVIGYLSLHPGSISVK